MSTSGDNSNNCNSSSPGIIDGSCDGGQLVCRANSLMCIWSGANEQDQLNHEATCHYIALEPLLSYLIKSIKELEKGYGRICDENQLLRIQLNELLNSNQLQKQSNNISTANNNSNNNINNIIQPIQQFNSNKNNNNNNIPQQFNNNINNPIAPLQFNSAKSQPEQKYTSYTSTTNNYGSIEKLNSMNYTIPPQSNNAQLQSSQFNNIPLQSTHQFNNIPLHPPQQFNNTPLQPTQQFNNTPLHPPQFNYSNNNIQHQQNNINYPAPQFSNTFNNMNKQPITPQQQLNNNNNNNKNNSNTNSNNNWNGNNNNMNYPTPPQINYPLPPKISYT